MSQRRRWKNRYSNIYLIFFYC